MRGKHRPACYCAVYGFMTRTYFFLELKRSLTNKFFCIALIINTALILFPFIFRGNNGYVIYESTNNPVNTFLLSFIGSFTVFPLIIMFTAPLAFSGSYANEYKTNFPDYIYPRISKFKYHMYKCVLSGLSGIIAVVLPTILLFSLTIIPNYTHITIPENGDWVIIDGPFSEIARNHPVLLCLLLIFLISTSTWIYSLFGYIGSLLYKKQWFAVIFPFTFFLLVGVLGISFNIEKYISFINMIAFYFFSMNEIAFLVKYLIFIFLQFVFIALLLKLKEDI